MSIVRVKKVEVDGENLSMSSAFRRFYVSRDEIDGFKVGRISSLFDEIGIELEGGRTFLITERASGFFNLVEFLHVEDAFGPLWYRDAEDGRSLEHTYESSIGTRKK